MVMVRLRVSMAMILASIFLVSWPIVALSEKLPDGVDKHPEQAKAARSVAIGVYDPHGAFKTTHGIAIEHVFIPWENVDVSSLKLVEQYAHSRGRRLMVTVEPWSWSSPVQMAPDQLRKNISEGHYDQTIDAICSQIADSKTPPLVRWGHEMDLSSGRYPWSNWKPADYIGAFRHVVDRCRRIAPKAVFIWSPRGDLHMNDYYPGDAYVDIVGLSIFGLQAYDRQAFGGERSLAELLGTSYGTAEVHKKPIMIAEYGCSGDDEYVKRCSDFSPAVLAMFPLLQSVVFYSREETADWPQAYGRPDWRVLPGSIAFIETVKWLRPGVGRQPE
jgi:beta-mannanase